MILCDICKVKVSIVGELSKIREDFSPDSERYVDACKDCLNSLETHYLYERGRVMEDVKDSVKNYLFQLEKDGDKKWNADKE